MEEFPKNTPEVSKDESLKNFKDGLIKEVEGLYANELEKLVKNLGIASQDQLIIDPLETINEFKKYLETVTSPSQLQVIKTQIRLIKEGDR